MTADNLSLSLAHSFKTTSPDIILCCLWIDENLVVTGNKDGSLVFYQADGRVINSAKAHKSSVCTLALINEGQYLASGSDHPNPEIILWNLSSLDPVCRLQEHKTAVSAIECLRDGEHMISGSYDKRLCVYSFHEQRLKYTLPSNKSSVTAICVNSDATRMISCGLEGNVLNIWQIIRDQSSNVHVQSSLESRNVVFGANYLEQYDDLFGGSFSRSQACSLCGNQRWQG